MSDLDKTVEQKLAECRKQSDKKETKEIGSRNTNKRDYRNEDEKTGAIDKKSHSSSGQKQDSKEANYKKNDNSEKANIQEKDNRNPRTKNMDKDVNREDLSESNNKSTSSISDRVSKEKDTNERSDHKPRDKSHAANRNRSSRDKSRSPMLFVRNYHYKENLDERYRDNRAHIRRRSRSPSHKTSRSPIRRRSPVRRRSPSPFRKREPWRRSPRRRSRSPRVRSPIRPYHNRSRSPGRQDPKALIAKKSFLDDLAVKFAQEGKEFPELEQYRCEINSQFISYPNVNQFSRNAVEHVASNMAGNVAFVDMNMMPNNPMVLTDPYNAYPMYPDTLPMAGPYNAYPIQGDQSVLNSPGISLECPQQVALPTQPIEIQQTNIARSTTSNHNEGKSKTTEIWTKQEVKIRVKQALQLLDHVDKSAIRTGKFMFRAPTFYDNDVNMNRSPIVQSNSNPLYAFSSSAGASSDPFGNVPANLKAVVNALRLDEGVISQRIFQRHQQKQVCLGTETRKQEVEAQSTPQNNPLKTTLQKPTHTDPTVCTECLLRKIKIRYNEETQTDIVRTVNSVTQTNPMPVQTVTEFGSITELTPNQVRAVSELIKYIKLTATSGNLREMRDSLEEDQVYNLNSDLRMAYHYFDEMVVHQNPGGSQQIKKVESKLLIQPKTFIKPDTLNDDDNDDEYEKLHRAFCPDDEEENEEVDSYSNPLLLPSTTHRTMDNRYGFANSSSMNSFGTTGGNIGGFSLNQQGSASGSGAFRRRI